MLTCCWIWSLNKKSHRKLSKLLQFVPLTETCFDFYIITLDSQIKVRVSFWELVCTTASQHSSHSRPECSWCVMSSCLCSASSQTVSFYNKDETGEIQRVTFDSMQVKRIFHGSFHKVNWSVECNSSLSKRTASHISQTTLLCSCWTSWGRTDTVDAWNSKYVVYYR